MGKCKVVFKGVMPPELKDTFTAGAPQNVEVYFLNPGPVSEEELALTSDADFLIVHKHKAGTSLAQIIEKSNKLKLLHALSQGTDALPMSVAMAKKLPVTNIGGTTAISVAEHAVLLMLAALKRLPLSIDAIHKEKPQMEIKVEHVYRLYEKTVGIIGFGNVGRYVAGIVRGFGANVIFVDAFSIPSSVYSKLKARQVGLEELLTVSDVISLHIPLIDSTRKMIGWKQILMMKSSAIIVNTSRGPVIDEPALIRGLEEKKIAGAGLDVWEKEPPDPANPLLHMENVVATPHIASEVKEDYLLQFKLTWENISLILEGKRPHNICTS